MLDRVRIWTLRQAGHTLEEIAASVGVGKSSVQRILKEPPITSPESAPTPASRRIGRPSRVEAFLARAAGAVEEDPLVVLDGLGHVAGGVGPDEGRIGLGDQGVLDAVAGGHRAAGHFQAVVQALVDLADVVRRQEAGEMLRAQGVFGEPSPENLRLDLVVTAQVRNQGHGHALGAERAG